MKIIANVIEANDCGDTLRIVLQGKEGTAADWRPLSRQEIRISDTIPNRRAFHLGREVEITVRPR